MTTQHPVPDDLGSAAAGQPNRAVPDVTALTFSNAESTAPGESTVTANLTGATGVARARQDGSDDAGRPLFREPPSTSS